MMQVEHEVADAGAGQPADDAAHEGFAIDGDGGFRADVSQRLQSSAKTRGEQERAAAPGGQLPSSDSSNTMSGPAMPNSSRSWRNTPRYESRM